MLKRLPVVSVFVRHRSQCPKKHHGEGHQGCDCAKWLRYFLHGKLHRVSADTRSWELAQGKAKELQEQLNKGQTGTRVAPDSSRRTVRDEVSTYIAKKQGDNTVEATLRKLRYQLNLFVEFLEKRSKFYAADITRDDVIQFRSQCWRHEDGGEWGDLTRIRAQGNLRGFIRFACGSNQQELLKALDRIRETKSGIKRRKPQPFKEAEITKLLAQVPKTFAGDPEKIKRHQTLLRLIVSTGLAGIDAIQLEKSTLEQAKKTGVLKVTRQKTGRDALPPINKGLLDELTAVLNGHEKYVFWSGDFLADSETKKFREEIGDVMKDAGLYIEGNVLHRLRDTCVDFWISEGWGIDDIARGLGDTVAIVQKHYEDRLSERVQQRMAALPTRTWA